MPRGQPGTNPTGPPKPHVRGPRPGPRGSPRQGPVTTESLTSARRLESPCPGASHAGSPFHITTVIRPNDTAHGPLRGQAAGDTAVPWPKNQGPRYPAAVSQSKSQAL